MAKLAGLESVSRGALAAEVALPPPADLLSLPPGALSRVLVLDGVQVRAAAGLAGPTDPGRAGSGAGPPRRPPAGQTVRLACPERCE